MILHRKYTRALSFENLTTGVLEPETSWIAVALSNVTDPGHYGPEYAPVTYDAGLPDGNRNGHPGVGVLGSQSKIEPTGKAWKLIEASRLFASGLGDYSNEAGLVWNSTRKEAGGVVQILKSTPYIEFSIYVVNVLGH